MAERGWRKRRGSLITNGEDEQIEMQEDGGDMAVFGFAGTACSLRFPPPFRVNKPDAAWGEKERGMRTADRQTDRAFTL